MISINTQITYLNEAIAKSIVCEGFDAHVDVNSAKYVKVAPHAKLLLNARASVSDSTLFMSNYCIIFDQVEKYLQMLTAIPSVHSIEAYRGGELLLPTFYDMDSDFHYNTLSIPLSSKEDALLWNQNLLEYISGQGKTWLSKFGSISKVNSYYSGQLLQENGVMTIFNKNPLDLFRVLILSSLAFDGLMERKYDMIYESLYTSNVWADCFSEFEDDILPNIKSLTIKEVIANPFSGF